MVRNDSMSVQITLIHGMFNELRVLQAHAHQL